MLSRVMRELHYQWKETLGLPGVLGWVPASNWEMETCVQEVYWEGPREEHLSQREGSRMGRGND